MAIETWYSYNGAERSKELLSYKQGEAFTLFKYAIKQGWLLTLTNSGQTDNLIKTVATHSELYLSSQRILCKFWLDILFLLTDIRTCDS